MKSERVVMQSVKEGPEKKKPVYDMNVKRKYKFHNVQYPGGVHEFNYRPPIKGQRTIYDFKWRDGEIVEIWPWLAEEMAKNCVEPIYQNRETDMGLISYQVGTTPRFILQPVE
jgi:hypothetical protein